MVEDVHVKLRGLVRTCWSGVVSISITASAGPSSYQVTTTTTEDTTASFSRGSDIAGVTPLPGGLVVCFTWLVSIADCLEVLSFRVVGAFLTRTHPIEIDWLLW